MKNLTIEEKKDFQDLNNAEIIKASLLKKITLNALITMNIEEKRNLGLKNMVEGEELDRFEIKLFLVYSSYVDHLQFIKNKPHKDSLKMPLKLDLNLI